MKCGECKFGISTGDPIPIFGYVKCKLDHKLHKRSDQCSVNSLRIGHNLIEKGII